MNDTAGGAAAETPAWIEELQNSLRFHSQYVLSGNIRDCFLFPDASSVSDVDMMTALWDTLAPQGCTWMVSYDRVDGLVLRHRSDDAVLPPSLKAPPLSGNTDRSKTVDQDNTTMRRWLRATQVPEERQTSGVLVMDFASRLAQPLEGPSAENELTALFQLAEKMSFQARQAHARESDGLALPYSPVIWLADNAHDLPDFLRVGNERVRTIMVGLPGRSTRNHIASNLLHGLRLRLGLEEEQAQRFAHQFVLLTEGMKLTSIYQLTDHVLTSTFERADQADVAAGTAPIDPVQEFAAAVRAFRVGATRDPWRDDTVRNSIRSGYEQVSREVKGQEFAVRKTLDILKRSVTGLSGAQAGRSAGRPRGVLFFAGPTGVGKTELAKQITRLLFGDESAYHRFDMSEFAQEHSEARLIGAPPGYVGHDAGGQLVNAVRERPFSVLLFDEIEKAHPRILDKFLQILEDGRLTDGRGDTVYFSESVIIFTSNLGIYKEEVVDGRTVKMPNATAQTAPTRADLEALVLPEIEDYFRYRIQRPELLNRIGKNLLVFDFIREDVAREIMRKMLGNVRQRVMEEHRVELVLDEPAMATLELLCLEEAAVNGGRGIGNALEEALINPLARALFEVLPLHPGSRLRAKSITHANDSWEVDLASD